MMSWSLHLVISSSFTSLPWMDTWYSNTHWRKVGQEPEMKMTVSMLDLKKTAAGSGKTVSWGRAARTWAQAAPLAATFPRRRDPTWPHKFWSLELNTGGSNVLGIHDILHQVVKLFHCPEPGKYGKCFILSLWSFEQISCCIPHETGCDGVTYGVAARCRSETKLCKVILCIYCIGGSQPWLHLGITWRGLKKFLCPSLVPDRGMELQHQYFWNLIPGWEELRTTVLDG